MPNVTGCSDYNIYWTAIHIVIQSIVRRYVGRKGVQLQLDKCGANLVATWSISALHNQLQSHLLSMMKLSNMASIPGRRQ